MKFSFTNRFTINIRFTIITTTSILISTLLSIIPLASAAYTPNATNCMVMYQNNQTDVPCLSNSTCCYLEFNYYDKNFTNCYLKINETDNMCSTMTDYIETFSGTSVSVCDCSGFNLNLTMKNSIIFSIFIFMYILL